MKRILLTAILVLVLLLVVGCAGAQDEKIPSQEEIAEELESLTDSLKQELGEANEAIRQSAPDVYESIQGWIEQIKEFVDSLTSEE